MTATHNTGSQLMAGLSSKISICENWLYIETIVFDLWRFVRETKTCCNFH